MAGLDFNSLLAQILANPQSIAGDVLETISQMPNIQAQMLIGAAIEEDTLTRTAIAGLLFDMYTHRPECVDLPPLDPSRSPASGFTIRDINILPKSTRRAKSHKNPNL